MEKRPMKHTKLTKTQVNEIRNWYKKRGATQRFLAAYYGVSQGQIGRIVNNQQWKPTKEKDS